MGTKQFLLSGESKLTQSLPGLVQVLLPFVDDIHFRVALSNQLFCQGVNLGDPVFLGSHVLLELIKLALENFYMLQVNAKFLGGYKRLLIIDPVHDFVTLPLELHQYQGLLESHALVG